MEEQDYKAIALSRLTDRHRSDEAFISILDTLVDLKETRQKEILQISESFLDIDKSEGKNLDVIGKLIGEERNLVNFIDRSYFGFLGARLSESYDIGYWYSLYKNKYGTLRTLTDEEYRRVLKARVLKNSSDNGRNSLLEVLNILSNNTSAIVIEDIDNRAISLSLEDNDGLVSYYLSKYKNDRNLIPLPMGRRIGVTYTDEKVESFWEYVILPFHDDAGYVNLTPPSSGWLKNDTMPYDDTNGWIRSPDLSVIWVRKTVYANSGDELLLTVGVDNGCVVWLDGVLAGSSNRDNLDITTNQDFPVSLEHIVTEKGSVDILIKAFTESTSEKQSGNYLNVDVKLIEPSNQISKPYNLTGDYTP